MSAHVQRSPCSAIVGVHEREPWTGMPMPCGVDASGPHPDPARGYREPLCRRHLIGMSLGGLLTMGPAMIGGAAE